MNKNLWLKFRIFICSPSRTCYCTVLLMCLVNNSIVSDWVIWQFTCFSFSSSFVLLNSEGVSSVSNISYTCTHNSIEFLVNIHLIAVIRFVYEVEKVSMFLSVNANSNLNSLTAMCENECENSLENSKPESSKKTDS